MAEPTKLGITITSLSPDLNKDVEAIVTRALEEIRRVVGLDILIQSEVASDPITVWGSNALAMEFLDEVGGGQGGAWMDVKDVDKGQVNIDGHVCTKEVEALSFLMRRGA